jgi:hypothetical protein
VKMPSQWSPRAREKLAVTLMTVFLFGWIGVSLGVQTLQIHQQGYGSGITNRGHLPDQIRDRYRIPGITTPQQLLDATSR